MTDLRELLSSRELDVLACMVRGASNKEIAAELSISLNTVKVHLRNIFAKLEVSSRLEAVTVAMKMGLVSLPGVPPSLNDSNTLLLTPTPSNLNDEEDAPADEPTLLVEPTNEPTMAVIPEPVLEPNERVEPISTTAVAASPTREAIPVPEPIPPSNPATRAHWGWSTAVLGILLLLALVVIAWQGFFQPRFTTPTPESLTPFVEQAIGDTRWLESRPLNTETAGLAVATVGLKIYAIGGETAVGVVGDVHVYDVVAKSWQTAANKPTAVSDTTAAVLFGEVYVPGGRTTDGSVTALVEAYSPTNNAWRRVASLPEPISGGLALSDGSFLYLFGGWNGKNLLDTAYVYDPGADSWRPLPAMPSARTMMAGAVLTGQFYVVGGSDGQKELALCQTFAPLEQTWSDCPPMLEARAGAGAAVLLNKLYVVGGGSAENPIQYSELYDPNTQTWQVVNTPMLTDAPDWVELGVTSVETRLYTLGGRRNGRLLADNVAYNPFIYQTFLPNLPEK